MNVWQYGKDRVPVILGNLLGMAALSLFLSSVGNNMQTILFIAGVWTAVLLLWLVVSCFVRKRHLDHLLRMTEQLEERYLIPEVMPKPLEAEEQVFYRILKMAEKSMLEKTGAVQRERKEYKEFIEQWIHEIKAPITAMRLICENNQADFTRELLTELEKVNGFTEQALYYARSEHTETDYLVREIRLGDVVHDAIADNKYLLRQNRVAVTVEEMTEEVCSDEKWVRFILDQLISNAVKYGTEQPRLHFFTEKQEGKVVLFLEDNGRGIPESDLPRIFEKGFTGQNGRMDKRSTGMGLYLCRRLCDKLGIGLEACSKGQGTTMMISFAVNDFIRWEKTPAAQNRQEQSPAAVKEKK